MAVINCNVFVEMKYDDKLEWIEAGAFGTFYEFTKRFEKEAPKSNYLIAVIKGVTRYYEYTSCLTK